MGEVWHKHAGLVEEGAAERLYMLVMLGFGCLFANIHLRGDGREVCRDKFE